MIVSHRKRFILLSPWKTASSTMHARLDALNESPYSRFFDYNPILQRVVHQHITYSDFAMLPESRAGYLVGAFVRNPYDKVYSGFLQLQRDIRDHPSVPFPAPWIKALVMRQLAENFAQLSAAEFEFNQWFASIEPYQVREIGRNSSLPLHPAAYWTGVAGQTKVDFVGRAEDFERDFGRFCDQVGITIAEDVNANVTQRSEIEPGQHGPYRYTHLMSTATVNKIEDLFDQDFALFGYRKHHGV